MDAPEVTAIICAMHHGGWLKITAVAFFAEPLQIFQPRRKHRQSTGLKTKELQVLWLEMQLLAPFLSINVQTLPLFLVALHFPSKLPADQ